MFDRKRRHFPFVMIKKFIG